MPPLFQCDGYSHNLSDGSLSIGNKINFKLIKHFDVILEKLSLYYKLIINSNSNKKVALSFDILKYLSYIFEDET